MRSGLLKRKFRFENVRDKHDETNAATLQRKEADPTANEGKLRDNVHYPKRGKRRLQMGECTAHRSSCEEEAASQGGGQASAFGR